MILKAQADLICQFHIKCKLSSESWEMSTKSSRILVCLHSGAWNQDFYQWWWPWQRQNVTQMTSLTIFLRHASRPRAPELRTGQDSVSHEIWILRGVKLDPPTLQGISYYSNLVLEQMQFDNYKRHSRITEHFRPLHCQHKSKTIQQ